MAEEIDEQAMVEYLRNNRLFSKAWFVQNAPKEFIQEWFNFRRQPLSNSAKVKLSTAESSAVTSNGTYNPNAIFLSVSNLLEDERHDDDDDEQLTASAYAQIARDGRNSITLELFHDIVSRGSMKKKSREQLSREQLKEKFQGMNEHELFMELISDITNELDIDTLCHKILVNVCILTNSDRASLFLAKGSRDRRFLIAQLFDVTPECLIEDALMAAEEYKKIPPMPFGTGIVGHVALSKQNVNIEDAYEDSRFNKDIDSRTGYHTKSLMCQPIVNFGGDVIGVAECINKLSDDQKFTKEDEEVFQKYLTFCGIGIQNAQLFEMSVLEYKRNQLLLSLARTIFEDTSSLDVLINKIMVKAKGMLDCEVCRVYLVDNEHDAVDAKYTFKAIFELKNESDDVQMIEINSETDTDYVEYARQVALTGKDGVYSDSILSVPILNDHKKVLGVAQLIKTQKETFNDVDIGTLEGFSIFIGLGIHNCMMYERALKLNARQKVALEVLAYHASSTIEETVEFMNTPVASAETYNIYSFQFDDLVLSDKETCQATIRMFTELNFLNQFRISYMVLCRWTLSIKKNYRQVLYHNWRHALNVSQSMFIMLTTYGLNELMTPQEQLALIVASMCHDLDHRGTNNSFQTKSGSPLATLYSSSIMENHHFYHCQLILKAEGNNILKSLTGPEYKEIIKIIEQCILSTDLEQYFKKKDKFAELVRSGEKEWKDPHKRDLIRAMMMTACDLSAICKPWRVQKRVAEMVASEFFEQGDLEKSMQQTPNPMMDRNRKDELPSMQVGFIEHIGLPLYQVNISYF
ncbi:PREDICTED: cGMP-specific 3',5'-cyclic phosphodiesterase-like [Rhagoletis zephyria]|uniref:cGMP-specific 3',5'-cyclic phosphodiesterase-like n=1 Tax=Rhagoletis zephyria TaxID=28612 RepID=UPI000811A401|nr:PREDICTED: cGMP-specific 3',5'-cyclic phosphodiesterase-like [Rhagoletis zephyria]